jgi:AcrR family transcriptional regulator
MTKRLTAQDWINFALRTLAHEGFDAMKADVLARKLGVSRGSFYWHFSDLDGFHARVIEHWRQLATEAIIADIERMSRAKSALMRFCGVRLDTAPHWKSACAPGRTTTHRPPEP